MFSKTPRPLGRDSRAQKKTPTNVATLAGAYKAKTTPAILQARHAIECAAARVSPMLACGASLSPVLSPVLANAWGAYGF